MIRRWWAAGAVVVLLVGAGIFFLAVGLGDADRYASVGSFLLALAVAGGTVAMWFRSRSRAAEVDPVTPPPGSRNAYGDGPVIQGDRSVNDITINYGRGGRSRKG